MLMPTKPKLKSGYQLRPPTMADLETAVRLFNIRDTYDYGHADISVEDIRSEWTAPGFDIANSIRLVFADDGTLTGYVEVWDTAENPVHPWVWGCVHPEYERQGVGSVLLAWAIERARQAIDRVPADARVSVIVDALSTNAGAHRLFENFGMTGVRTFYHMAIDLNGFNAAPKWPEGITVTTYADLSQEKDVLRPLYRAVVDAFRDHWGHVERDEEEGLKRWEHRLETNPDFDPSLWFVALDGDDIAGFSLNKFKANDDPDMGWVNTLGVRRPWRRRGLALALLQHSFAAFKERGQARAGLGVDASSLTNATALYEKAGMHVNRQYDAYELELRPGVELANTG